MTNQELHTFLRLELPARESEIVERLAVLRRALPAAYKDWPADAKSVSAALHELEAAGLLTKELGEWRWVGRVEKVTERRLFA